MRLSQVRLSSWIVLSVITAVLSTALMLVLVLDHYAQKYAQQQANMRLQQLAWQMRDAMDRGIHERFVDMRLIATAEATLASGELRNLLERLQESQPRYAWIGIAKPDGTVKLATDGLLEGVDVSQRPWFQNARMSQFAGDYHPALLLEKKLPQQSEPWRFIDVALPLLAADGSLRGVLGSHLSWGWARDTAVSLFDPTQENYGVEVFVVRKDGTVLLGPDAFEERKIEVPSFGRAQENQSGAVTETWPDGRFITGFARTNLGEGTGLGWSILVRQPVNIAMREFNTLEHNMLIASVGITLLLALIAAFFARRLAHPLKQLSAAIEKRMGPESEAPIPRLDDYHEASLLSTALSGLVAIEKYQRDALRALNLSLEAEVDARTAELRAAAEQLQAALLDQHVTKETLRESEAELRAILDHAHDAFIAIDEGSHILEWNPQAERLFGWSISEAIGRDLADLIIPEKNREAHRQGMQRFLEHGAGPVLNRRIELTALRRDGREIPVEVTISPVPRQDGHMFIASLHDITERRAMQAALEEMAWRDALTGLPNRRSFLDLLPKAMARARRLKQAMAVLFIDLDGFKAINDTHGHDAGDELLRQFAQRIVAAVRSSDTVARLAGDEFTVILEQADVGTLQDQVGRKLLSLMQLPFDLGVAQVTLSSSVGIAVFAPDNTSSPEQLLHAADQAMYAAKHAGKNRVHIHV